MAVRPSEQLYGLVPFDFEYAREDPLTAILKLLTRHLQIHHQVAVDLPHTNHRSGRDGVEHQLGRRARFHPGRSGDHLWTDERRNDDVEASDQLSRGIRTHQKTDGRPSSLSAVHSPVHVGRTPGCRYAEDEVTLVDLERIDRPSAILRVILRTFLGSDQGLESPRNDPSYHGRMGPIGWWHLGGIQHTETARGTSPHVDESAAGAERTFREFQGASDRFTLLPDRGRDHAILGVDQIDDPERVELVDTLGSWVALFGESGVAQECLFGRQAALIFLDVRSYAGPTARGNARFLEPFSDA